MTIHAYLRVSTEEQANSGLGLEAQRERIQSYLPSLPISSPAPGTSPSSPPVLWYVDEGISGGKLLRSRPAGGRLLSGLQPGDSIVAVRLDRLFRRALDCLQSLEGWEKQGVSLHLLDLGGSAVSSSSATGRMMFSVLAAMAEFERGLACERTKSALQAAKARGTRLGRPEGTGRPIREWSEGDEHMAQRILSLRAGGASLRQVCAIINSEGALTPKGKAWAPGSISELLRRREGWREWREREGA